MLAGHLDGTERAASLAELDVSNMHRMHPGFNVHVHMHNSDLAQLMPVVLLEFIATKEDGS